MNPGETHDRFSISRRRAMQALAGAGVGTAGLGHAGGLADRAAARHDGVDPERPVAVSRRLSDEHVWTYLEHDKHIQNDTTLWYWGAFPHRERDAWVHRFFVTALGLDYAEPHDGSDPVLGAKDIGEHEVTVDVTDDASIREPYTEEMVGVANPYEFYQQVQEDPELTTADLAAQASQQRDGLESMDFEKHFQEWDADYQSVSGGPTAKTAVSLAVIAIGIKYPPVGLALDLLLAASDFMLFNSEEEVDPGSSFSWPPDPSVPIEDRGISEIFAGFDVVVPISDTIPRLEVGSRFHGRGDDVEVSWELELGAPRQPAADECLSELNVRKAQALQLFTDDYDVEQTLYSAGAPDPTIQEPAAYESYGVDETLPLEPTEDLWRNEWHADWQVEGACSELTDAEVDSGSVSTIHSPGRWDLVHNGRNRAGINARDRTRIIATEDEAHVAVPAADEPTLDGHDSVPAGVDLDGTVLPVGEDEYSEVGR